MYMCVFQRCERGNDEIQWHPTAEALSTVTSKRMDPTLLLATSPLKHPGIIKTQCHISLCECYVCVC